jgi:hypothetical protein
VLILLVLKLLDNNCILVFKLFSIIFYPGNQPNSLKILEAKLSLKYSEIPLCLLTELLGKRSVMLRKKQLSDQNKTEIFPRTVLPLVRFRKFSLTVIRLPLLPQLFILVDFIYLRMKNVSVQKRT